MTQQTLYLFIYLCISISIYLSLFASFSHRYVHHIITITHYSCQLIYYIHVVHRDDELILKRIWDSERHWYKTQEVIIREKEEEKWSVEVRKKDKKLTILQSSESSLKYTIDILNKREIIISINC